MTNIKTWGSSNVIDNTSDIIKFDNTNSDTIIGIQEQLVGSPGVEQLTQFINNPTVQAALDDILNGIIPSVGDIIIKPNFNNPAGVPMSERLTITGNITKDTLLLIYGQPVMLTAGDTDNSITDKVLQVLADMVHSKLALSNVKKSEIENEVQPNMIDLSFIDRRKHINTNIIGDEYSITGQTIVMPVAGFGEWEFLSKNDTLIIGVDLYFWRRIK